MSQADSKTALRETLSQALKLEQKLAYLKGIGIKKDVSISSMVELLRSDERNRYSPLAPPFKLKDIAVPNLKYLDIFQGSVVCTEEEGTLTYRFSKQNLPQTLTKATDRAALGRAADRAEETLKDRIWQTAKQSNFTIRVAEEISIREQDAVLLHESATRIRDQIRKEFLKAEPIVRYAMARVHAHQHFQAAAKHLSDGLFGTLNIEGQPRKKTTSFTEYDYTGVLGKPENKTVVDKIMKHCDPESVLTPEEISFYLNALEKAYTYGTHYSAHTHFFEPGYSANDPSRPLLQAMSVEFTKIIGSAESRDIPPSAHIANQTGSEQTAPGL